MNLGQRYVCINPLCRCEIKVTRASLDVQGNPKCCCGAEMKKPYTKPVLRELALAVMKNIAHGRRLAACSKISDCSSQRSAPSTAQSFSTTPPPHPIFLQASASWAEQSHSPRASSPQHSSSKANSNGDESKSRTARAADPPNKPSRAGTRTISLKK